MLITIQFESYILMTDRHQRHSLLFIRHGETTSNANRVASGGDSEPSLTDAGRCQIYEAVEILKHLDEIPASIICSANKRSIESANILQECFEASIASDALFNERSLGEWNNVSLDIVNPMLAADKTPRNGESRAEFKERFWSAMHRYRKSILNNRTIIVGSRGTARILLETVNAEKASLFQNGQLLKISLSDAESFEVVDIKYLN